MTTRKPIIAGNWKMYKTATEARSVTRALVELLGNKAGVEIVVCPPYTALQSAGEVLAGTNIALGAQDLFWENEGAYTGEISAPMLRDLGCTYVIVGHSERRGYFGETDEAVGKKAQAALEGGLRPIICVGETLEQRDAGLTDQLVSSQTKAAFSRIPKDRAELCVVAYEPVWAIGTGRNATGEEANRVIGLIRAALVSMYGNEVASRIRIQYGGSVKPGNIGEFMAQPEIDGALVGGASLNPESFAAIVNYSAK